MSETRNIQSPASGTESVRTTREQVTGLRLLAVTALLLLGLHSPGQAKGLADWSDVPAVAPGTKTIVLLFKDQARRGSRKIKGVFASATAESITVMTPDGQARTLDKKSVRTVLIRRPWSKRYPGWFVLGGGIMLYEATWGRSDDLTLLGKLVVAYGVLVYPVAALTFYGLRLKALYKILPEQRIP